MVTELQLGLASLTSAEKELGMKGDILTLTGGRKSLRSHLKISWARDDFIHTEPPSHSSASCTFIVTLAGL